MNSFRTWDTRLLQLIGYLFVGFMGLFALFPFVMLLVSSFSSESYILRNGYTLWPAELSFDAYSYIFKDAAQVFSSYKISIFVTAGGTAISLLLSSMAAYVLYRKEVRCRNALAFYLFFTTLFNGGLAPYYIMISNYLHLKNTIWVLLLTPMFNVLYILILRSFIKGAIPDALVESAKMDGAGDLRIFGRIVLPLLKPALASIGLFIALGYWNDWWTSMMFVEKPGLYPLQYLLYRMLSFVNISDQFSEHVSSYIVLPKETFKLALTVVATGPILLVYPFVQKYFVSGVTIGAVKG